jgi:hypothetical protein
MKRMPEDKVSDDYETWRAQKTQMTNPGLSELEVLFLKDRIGLRGHRTDGMNRTLKITSH